MLLASVLHMSKMLVRTVMWVSWSELKLQECVVAELTLELIGTNSAELRRNNHGAVLSTANEGANCLLTSSHIWQWAWQH